MEFAASDHSHRSTLEEAVISAYGRTVDKKDAQIVGTVVELHNLGLRHNQTVWGVIARASDYKVNNQKGAPRGKRHPSKLNGVPQ